MLYNQAAAAQATSGNNIAFLNLGLNYYLLNLYDKAQEILEGYLTEAPNDADAHFYLGCVYHKMGSEEKGLIHLQKAVELNPYYKESVIQFDKQTTTD